MDRGSRRRCGALTSDSHVRHRSFDGRAEEDQAPGVVHAFGGGDTGLDAVDLRGGYMDILGKTIWQQAAGDTERNFVDLCLKWDVILNGPGGYGPWPECEDDLRKAGESERKITDLRRFCEQMNDGDIVVLRLGTSLVYGVGRIVDGYEWCDSFNDVDGWYIGHARRVRWLWKYNEQHNGKPWEFETYALKRGDTTQKLDSDVVKSWVESLKGNELARTPICLPKADDSAEISVDSISEYLFDKGVASNSISRLLDQIGELIRIANWYDRSGEVPSENETINYLVVPLLRTLGWTPQKMSIEWNRIDVALFSSLPRKKEHLSVVVEAKKIKAASLSALSQAEDYAEDYNNCRRIILTDGLRYGIFTRDRDASCEQQKFSLYAYMKLTSLRDGYPIHGCRGAKDALLAMGPEWNNRS